MTIDSQSSILFVNFHDIVKSSFLCPASLTDDNKVRTRLKDAERFSGSKDKELVVAQAQPEICC